MESKLKRVVNIKTSQKQQSEISEAKEKLDEKNIVKDVKNTLAQFTDRYQDNSIIHRKDVAIIIMIFIWIFIVVTFSISISTSYTPLRFAY